MLPNTVYGNVIEYIADRLCLASYTSTPGNNTPFPPPPIPDPYRTAVPKPVHARSPSKRDKKGAANSSGLTPIYFTVDDSLLYNAFHHDFGPLHVGHLYRFAILLHEILGEVRNEKRVVVFWSKPDARSRANAGCLLAAYMVLVQAWPPHLALSPLAQCDPPLMPFRDAGYSQADFVLNVQDVVYGVWRAKEKGLLDLKKFSLDEYEKFERVDMGDFNWVTPDFLAFASPQYPKPLSNQTQSLPSTRKEVLASSLPVPFKNVLEHFHSRDIGLVVRLNSHLYPAEYFTSLGMTHLDMVFDDGTCPPLNLVRKFINIAHKTIEIDNKHIAVHCKAGLGRTGCLIGAYLCYRYGFTANEVIAYMRFMRPGMVVGPQQHWLHLHQDEFRQWWFEDTILASALEKQSSQLAVRTPTKGKRTVSITTPHTKRNVLGEMDSNEASTGNALPAPTPGQPRKTSTRYAPSTTGTTSRRAVSQITQEAAAAADSREETDENEAPPAPPPQASPIRRKKSSKVPIEPVVVAADDSKVNSGNTLEVPPVEAMTDEEYLLRLHRRTTSRSPSGKRSVSYTTTTTTSVTHTVTPPTEKTSSARDRSGSGIGVKVRSSPRRTVAGGGVRKVSGRVVSSGGKGV